MKKKSKSAEKSRKQSMVLDLRKMQYWELADLVWSIHKELKERNPIGVNMYTHGLAEAEANLREIAAAEVFNPTSDCGPKPTMERV